MLDVTTDSQSVCKRLRKQRLCGTSMDLFERFEETQRFIDPFWVNSHMAEQEFKPNLVNKTIGDASSMPGGCGGWQKSQSGKELDIGSWNQGKDAVARQINKLLAENDKDQARW